MDLSFLRSEVSLQFKEQEEENRNPGREKETQEKEKKGIQGGLEEKEFACLFSHFFQGGKGRKRGQMTGKKGSNERKKGIKWQEKGDQMTGKKDQMTGIKDQIKGNARISWKVPGKCCGSSRIVIPIPACSSPGASRGFGTLILRFPSLDF